MAISQIAMDAQVPALLKAAPMLVLARLEYNQSAINSVLMEFTIQPEGRIVTTEMRMLGMVVMETVILRQAIFASKFI